MLKTGSPIRKNKLNSQVDIAKTLISIPVFGVEGKEQL